jgi:hypothetical protein
MFAPAGSIAANVLGACGVLGNFAWPLFRRRESMLAAQATACAFFTAHFLLIGATTGAVMTTLAGVQAILAIPLGTRPGFRIVYLLTVPVTAVAVAFTWHGVPSLFAALGLTLTSIGRYQLAVLPFRALILSSIPAWSLHNFLVGSVPGLSSDALTLSSGGWMLFNTYRETRLLEAACRGKDTVTAES